MSSPGISARKSEFYIVIVDHEKDFLSSMEFWFKAQGYMVKAFESGHEAVEVIRKKAPGIVFLNLQMPQREGLETLRRIREVNGSIPVVMLSSFGVDEGNIDAYRLGVNGFFDKSHNFYQAEHLINALVRIVAGKRSRRFVSGSSRLRIGLLIMLAVMAGFDLFLLNSAPLRKVCFKDACLNVELAATPRQRERGLMGRLSLDKDRGMLFVFPSDDFWVFWMKDTKVPLDIIWMDRSGKVVDIVENAQPVFSQDPPTFKSVFPARYVLEANAGFAKENNIKVGDVAQF